MKVFRSVAAAPQFACFITNRDDDKLLHEKFFGETHAANWVPLHIVRRLDMKGDDRAPLADVATLNSMSHLAVWGPRTCTALAPYLAKFGEFLPLECAETPWTLFNVTRTINALDEPASDIKYFPGEPLGRVLRFIKMVFNPAALRGELIFRLPQRRGAHLWVTDEFVRIVTAAGLTGFQFEEDWRDA